MRSLRKSRVPVRAGLALAVGVAIALGGLSQPGAGAAPAGIFPNLSVSPGAGPAGSPITVSGSVRLDPVVAPAERVAIYFDGALVGGATTDWYGRFSASIVVPANASPGAHLIQAIGRQSGASLWGGFRVSTGLVRPSAAQRPASASHSASASGPGPR